LEVNGGTITSWSVFNEKVIVNITISPVISTLLYVLLT